MGPEEQRRSNCLCTSDAMEAKLHLAVHTSTSRIKLAHFCVDNECISPVSSCNQYILDTFKSKLRPRLDITVFTRRFVHVL
jgi:hypothetical protein